MVLAFEARRATRYVDATFKPHGAVVEEARAVANEMGLPPSWLNDQVSVYVSRVADNRRPSVYDHPNLRVRSASARHLLAMKAHAARAFAPDREDLVVLVRHLGLTTASEVERICSEVFPDEPLSDRSRQAVEDAVVIVLADDPHSAKTDGTEADRAHALRGVSARRAPGSPRAEKASCGLWIESAGAPCVLKPTHRGNHRSRTR